MATLLAVPFVFSTAFAERHMIVPAFHWHDWIPVQCWCDGTSGAVYKKVLAFTFANVSNIDQEVTLTCTPKEIMSSSAANPGQTLQTWTQIQSGHETPGTSRTPLTHSFAVSPGASTVVNCFGLYRGPASGGDWHLAGVFDIKIFIKQDRGAITAVINSAFENTCMVAAYDPVGIAIMALRNTSRTILINGGRPF